MRPLRFLLLLGLFVVLPVILTCVSLFSSRSSTPSAQNVGYHARPSRLRALFSFTTPSSLFPPSAIISLTDDNSTSFLARPAAFGPSLPYEGLSGQLWIGKGFGEDIMFSEESLRAGGFELGCSDVPGWEDDHKWRPENGATDGNPSKISSEIAHQVETHLNSAPSKRDGALENDDQDSVSANDGTDDHLHHPLSDSNPASPEKPGEPASINNQDKSKPPNHADIESLQESADIAGKVVMLSRGGCGFLEKVKWAQRRGGVAVIVGDNEPGNALIIMYAKGDTSNVTIPAMFTSYYSAHLLSTLVPPEERVEVGSDGKPVTTKDGKSGAKDQAGNKKISGNKKSTSTKNDRSDVMAGLKDEKGWVQNVLSAVGIDDDADEHGEDSRRPPGSGNIDWVLLKDWDEDKPPAISTSVQPQKALKTMSSSTRGAKSQTTSAKKSDNDDFIIGIQDWRDTEVIAPKSTATDKSKKQKGKVETNTSRSSTSSSSSINPKATALKGGSITPGSGEYGNQNDERNANKPQKKVDGSEVRGKHSGHNDHQSFTEKIASFFRHENHKEIVHPRPSGHSSAYTSMSDEVTTDDNAGKLYEHHRGLWVTLTPTSSSTSPFFDTLLVLVVSPLVTLTFVYGLLLLRSRIRRRQWRAPKSIVERLPVRTYHTMSSTSSTTSSSVTSPQPSSPALGPVSQSRARPRSQTTTGVHTSNSSSSSEKSVVPSSPKRKRYTGRQVECVVCLEEYVDGESKVMSLPCGHEFHADCITPWLVTRRRTCPICKGDVVRSLARTSLDATDVAEDAREPGELTSDDVQDRAAMTQNSDDSAAIPIPVVEVTAMDSDIERGSDVDTPLLSSTPRTQQSRWRGILNSSFGRLSGDTLWRSSESDRTR